jgi:integrase
VVVLTPAQILQLVDFAGRHIAQALCIAALAPKLRLASILALRWDTHFDEALTTITVEAHKTRGQTKAPQVVPIVPPLRAILQEIRRAEQTEAARQTRRHGRARPPSGAVITWRGQPVASIKTGLRRAVEALGLIWGLRGVTFHVMRHSIATLLANPEAVGVLTERLRADVMGHKVLATTAKYTHLNPVVQQAPHAALAAALPGLHAALARKTGERQSRGLVSAARPGEIAGTPSHAVPQTPMNRRQSRGPQRAAKLGERRRFS